MFGFTFNSSSQSPIGIADGENVYVKETSKVKREPLYESLDCDTFEPLPDMKSERTIAYIYGSSGSGKTYFSNRWINAWKEQNKGKKVYLFSHLESDTSITYKPIRINVETLLDETDCDGNPQELIKLDDFEKGSMVVFDDIEGKSPQVKEIYRIMDELLTRGRHKNVSMVCIQHLGTNYKQTSTLLLESQYVVYFPHGSSATTTERVLKTYVGLDRKDIAKMSKLQSRWVLVKKTYPRICMFEKGAFFV